MTDDQGQLPVGLFNQVRRNAGIALWVGIVLIVAGFFAVMAPFVAGLSVALMIGVLLLAGGLSQCFLAFRAGALRDGLVVFIVGALMAATGIFLMQQPVAGLAGLTILLLAYLVATGILEIIVALQLRPADGWVPEAVSGAMSLILGLLLWRQFPLSGAWAIGVLFGIKMIFNGWALIFVSRAARAVANDVEAQQNV
jgi:uncharacterized membrane protein HdeD (DUF308 family)